MIPYGELLKVQEDATLKAMLDWNQRMKEFDSDSGIRPMTKAKTRMAQVEFQVKMAELQNKRERTKDKSDKISNELFVERFKIEDEIFASHGVETEHLLLLKFDEEKEENRQ